MSDLATRRDPLAYVKHALEVRRLARANEFDGARKRQRKEVFYFCDANVLIELGTIINLAHATNLFGICESETLRKFFNFELTEELGPEATGIIVGAFETSNYIQSGKLPAQAAKRIFVTDEHKDEFNAYKNYLQIEVDRNATNVKQSYESASEETAAPSNAPPIARVKELLTQIDDNALSNLVRDVSVLHRLSRLVRSGSIGPENLATGAALRYDSELADSLFENLNDTRYDNETNAKRDAVSLAKLMALQERWRADDDARRCVFVTRDSAIYRVYRQHYYDSELGKSRDADEWYLLREPAQFAPVLNINDLRGPGTAKPAASHDKQVFQNLGDAASGVVNALRILIRDPNDRTKGVSAEYREDGVFYDNVVSTDTLVSVREDQTKLNSLRDQWREATLASVAVNSGAAGIGDVLKDLTSWLNHSDNLQNLLKDVQIVSDQAAHDHAAFALQIVRDSYKNHQAPNQRSSIILFSDEQRRFDFDLPFSGTFADYRRAAIECLERDSWNAALFFAQRGRRICAKDSDNPEEELEANYLISVSFRLTLRRMSDLDEAASACKKVSAMARAHNLREHDLRARSELIAVQMTQWLYLRTAEEPWAATLRPAHLERAKFAVQNVRNNSFVEIKRLRERLAYRELPTIRQLTNGFLRNQIERQVQFNLFIARWLCSVAEHTHARRDDVDIAYNELTKYVTRSRGEFPLFMSALTNLARYFLEQDEEALSRLKPQVAQLRRSPETNLPVVATDRVLLEFLLRSCGSEVSEIFF